MACGIVVDVAMGCTWLKRVGVGWNKTNTQWLKIDAYTLLDGQIDKWIGKGDVMENDDDGDEDDEQQVPR